MLAGSFTAAAQNWTLLETQTYGAGGAWENGQKVRIDRSYQPGNFSYERKLTQDNTLALFSAKGVFSSLKEQYAPGEEITVDVTVSTSGQASAAPAATYGRVTLIPGNPEWSKAKLIKGTGAVEGQLTAEGGNAVANPAAGKTVKLTLRGKAPRTGDKMAIIFSCNGMDVVHVYGRDGGDATVASNPVSPVEEPANEETLAEEADDSEEAADVEEAASPAETVEGPSNDYPVPVAGELEYNSPILKPALLGLIALLIVADLVFMFRSPRKKK